MKQMNKMFQLYKMRVGSEMNFQRGFSIQSWRIFAGFREYILGFYAMPLNLEQYKSLGIMNI